MDGEVVGNNSSEYLPKTSSKIAEGKRRFAMNWTDHAQLLHREAHVLYLVFRDPRTPWYVKGVAAFPVAYLFSPVQLIPNFIPVIGFLDDLLVLLAGSKLIQRLTPTDLLRECREIVDQADRVRDPEPRIIRSAIIFTAVASLLAAGAASAILAAYIYR